MNDEEFQYLLKLIKESHASGGSSTLHEEGDDITLDITILGETTDNTRH